MNKTGKKRKKWVEILAVAGTISLAVLAGIGLANGDKILKNAGKDEQKENLISVGFSQVGAESGWRTGNSVSIKKTFSAKKGYALIFEDAQQQQEQQIKSIRNFIQQGVNYIILAPVVETGWDTVLEEAKAAHIPVIIADRKVKVKDESLYTTWVGADFYQEGTKACSWLNKYAKRNGRKSLNIVQIQGTPGATAQIGRTKALEDAAAEYGWTILDQKNGEFTQAKGQEVMEMHLEQYEDIDVVYCDNDNEALGAITAIKNAGKKLGTEGISVVSFDASKEGLMAVKNGEIAVDVECNPEFGSEIEKIIKRLEYKRSVNKEYYIADKVFAEAEEIPSIEAGKLKWDVVPVTEDIIKKRRY